MRESINLHDTKLFGWSRPEVIPGGTFLCSHWGRLHLALFTCRVNALFTFIPTPNKMKLELFIAKISRIVWQFGRF
ncbi:MAG: hypothetical protein ACI3YT_07555, partial [Prevotella sp.]